MENILLSSSSIDKKGYFFMSLQLRTAEFVSPKHPDKICDFLADSILDAHLAIDPFARVAVEVMGLFRQK